MLQANKTLWKYQADTAAWYFVSFTKKEIVSGLDIQKIPRGWGQIPVIVTIGETTWKTSLFPSKVRGYDLPIKAMVRKKEGIKESDNVTVIVNSA